MVGAADRAGLDVHQRLCNLGQFLLEARSQVLHARGRPRGVGARGQLGRDGQRHLAQAHEARGETADLARLAGIGRRPDGIDQRVQHGDAAQEALRPAAFEGELRGHLLPALTLRADQRIGAQLHVVEEHLVEMLAASEVADRADRDARQPQVDDELRHAFVARRRFVGGAYQRDHVVRLVGVRRPQLLAVERPARAVASRIRADAREVGS